MAIERQILQIMPADGWKAVYLQDKKPYYGIEPLAGWALVEGVYGGKAEREVVGLDAADDVVFVTELPNFFVYVHESGISNDRKTAWAKQGKERAERKKKQRQG
jgi:hypothetical protein